MPSDKGMRNVFKQYLNEPNSLIKLTQNCSRTWTWISRDRIKIHSIRKNSTISFVRNQWSYAIQLLAMACSLVASRNIKRSAVNIWRFLLNKHIIFRGHIRNISFYFTNITFLWTMISLWATMIFVLDGTILDKSMCTS